MIKLTLSLSFILFSFGSLSFAKDKNFIHLGSKLPVTTALSYHVTGRWDNWININLFASLTSNLPNMGGIHPGLAESWEVFDHGTRYVFKIRSDTAWSDGTPITAETVYQSFKCLLKNEKASPGTLLSIVDGAFEYRNGTIEAEAMGLKVIGDQELEFRLNAPARYFPTLLSLARYAPAPVHLFDCMDKDFKQEISSDWAYSGTFYIASGNGDGFIAERNPYYYDKAQVKFNGFTFTKLEDDFSYAYELMKEDRLDIIRSFVPDQTDFRDRLLKDYLLTGAHNVLAFFALNVNKPPLDQREIRQALYMSIDPEFGGLLKQSFDYIPAFSLVPPEIQNYPGDALPEWVSLSFEERRKKAREIMEKYGYSSTNPLKLEVAIIDNGMHKRTTNAVKSMWSHIYVDINVIARQPKEHYDIMRSGAFDVGRGGWSPDFNDPHDFLSILKVGSSFNYEKWDNAEYNHLVDKAQLVDTFEDTKRIQREAMAILQHEVPRIPLYLRSDYILLNPRLKGLSSLDLTDVQLKWLRFQGE